MTVSLPFGRGARSAPADRDTSTDVNEVAQTSRADLDAAYERGRRDEAKRRRGSPLVGFLILIIIAAAVGLFYLAAQKGSFANGGAVVDNDISQASQTATGPFRRAADKAGNALENAGQNLKQNAGDQPANPPAKP